MDNLIKLLKESGIGMITGNYRSYFSLTSIKQQIEKGQKVSNMNIRLSVENKFVGEYSLQLFDPNEISGDLFFKGEGANNVSIYLTPFETLSDYGTFKAFATMGRPEKYEE
jgi:hypothetical protein